MQIINKISTSIVSAIALTASATIASANINNFRGVVNPLGGFGIQTPFGGGSVSTPVGGFGIKTPYAGVNVNTPVGGFGIQTPFGGGSVSTPVGGFGIQTPYAGVNVNTPVGGFGMQAQSSAINCSFGSEALLASSVDSCENAGGKVNPAQISYTIPCDINGTVVVTPSVAACARTNGNVVQQQQ